MYIEYKKFWTEYTSKYGTKTAIFLQVGSFYEFYDVQDQETKNTEMNVKEIVDFLGIQLTIKKGEGEDGKDILFAGFPDYVLHKWAGKLTSAGWTVIVVNQIKDKHGKVKERKVARILTPGSHIEALSGSDAPIIAALWIVPSATEAPSFGAATFDLSTGSNYITSGTMKGTSESYSSDELLHFLSVFSPRELLIFWRSPSERQIPDENTLRKQFDFGSRSNVMHIRWVGDQGNLEKPAIREEYLRKLFNPKSILNIRTYLSLSSDVDHEERALCSLLRFVEDYLPSSFEQLQQTIRWSSDSLLLMGNHALSQLQILSSSQGEGGVLDLFDSVATTSFGKRALKTRLLTPSANPEIIERNLTVIDEMLRLSEDKRKELYKNLRVIYDIPRLHRKMLCAEVKEAEVNALHYSYMGSDGIFKELDMDRTITTGFLEALTTCFDLDRAANASKSYTFLHAKDHPELASIEQSIKEIEDSLEQYLQVLRKMCNANTTNIRKEEGDKVPYKITGTKTILSVLNGAKDTVAGKALMESMSGIQKNFGVTMKASGGVIDSPFIEDCNSRLMYLRHKLETQLAIDLPPICDKFCKLTSAYWMELEEKVAQIDMSLGLAMMSKARGWCRPQIVSSSGSGLKAKGLRHPLIENLIQKTRYIAHDVSLGNGSDVNGWLVYGMNASGKSSLMKSIGIAVHLAQAGCYVPATSFELNPYRSLFTRILNQDNLWAGLSSFAVEMSEMRDILRAADRYTLVLGDELCSGTESVSAKALVAAGIEWLSERNSSYVFATHLHGLTDVLPDPSSIALKVWHLQVTTDPFTGKLIYHRNLQPGAGSSLYGLEVAKAMDVPVKFLDKAHQIRRRLLGSASEEDAPTSSWNNAIIRRNCELCGSAAVKELEVHHIKPRAEGGDNHLSNLMVLCAACHDKHHAAPEVSKASVSLVQTSDGLERIIQSEISESKEKSATSKTRKGVLGEEDMLIVKDMIKTFPTLSAKQIVFRLKHMHNITVSEAKIRYLK